MPRPQGRTFASGREITEKVPATTAAVQIFDPTQSLPVGLPGTPAVEATQPPRDRLHPSHGPALSETRRTRASTVSSSSLNELRIDEHADTPLICHTCSTGRGGTGLAPLAH